MHVLALFLFGIALSQAFTWILFALLLRVLPLASLLLLMPALPLTARLLVLVVGPAAVLLPMGMLTTTLVLLAVLLVGLLPRSPAFLLAVHPEVS